MSTAFPVPASSRYSPVYDAAGGQTVFAYGFPIQAAADLAVWTRPEAAAGWSLLASGYTVTGAGSPAGGTIVLSAGATAGHQYLLAGAAAPGRVTDITAAGRYSPAALERDLDRFAIIAQELRRDLGRAMLLPLGEAAGLLPPAAARAGGVLSFNPVTGAAEASFALGDASLVDSAVIGELEVVATGGSAKRTLRDRFGTFLNALDKGILGDGATDRTAAINAWLQPGGRYFFPAGTYIVDGVEIPSNCVVIGEGPRRTVFKRKNGSTVNLAPIRANAKSGFILRDFGVDGNKANQTYAADSVQIYGCANWHVERIDALNAKMVGGGYGYGVSVADNADTGTTTSSIIHVRAAGNDGSGIAGVNSPYVSVALNHANDNGGVGIAWVTNTQPLTPTDRAISITANHCHRNAVGIQAGSYFGELTKLPAYGVVIAGNQCSFNTKYGLAFQGSKGAIADNTVWSNGDDHSNGGMLINALDTTVSGNVSSNNSYYGCDAGGSLRCTFTGNIWADNGSLAYGSIGMNLGASSDCQVIGDRAYLSAAATGGGFGFTCGEIDGGSTAAAFVNKGGRNHFAGVVVQCANDNQGGFFIGGGDPNGCSLAACKVYGTTFNMAYVYRVNVIDGGAGNKTHRGDDMIPSLAAATLLVIPDEGDLIEVTGSTTIERIQTFSTNQMVGKVRSVTLSNGGSGYAASFAVTASGGGGSGFAATALVVAGVVRAVRVDNAGSGYTSAPTLDFSAGTGGSGVAGTVNLGVANNRHRRVRLRFASTPTVKHNGNAGVGPGVMFTVSGADVTGAPARVVELTGQDGENWMMGAIAA